MSPSILDGAEPSLPVTKHGFDTGLFDSFGSWQIRQDILYLDNGAFGACPTQVSKKQEEIRRRIEENPHDFFERSYIPSWKASREALASFLNADVSGLVLLPGATYGMNVVIQSLSFNQGDEILTTNHAYSSVRLALDNVARRDGASIVVVDIQLMVASPRAVLDEILARVTARTRFAVIDHIPSRSGLIFPVKEVVSELASRNVDTLVDGAHAPGMIPLDIKAINAAYYVANCHKWMCAPRGVGFLHVRYDRAQNIKPLVFARSPHVVDKASYSNLEHSFTWLGTNDPSAVLSLPSCIDFLQTVIPGGHEALTRRNHSLAVLARRIICKTIGVPIPCPDHMIGAMATIPLPDSPGTEKEGMLPIQQILWQEHRVVIPVYSWPSFPKRVIRLSVQAYNFLEQYIRLANCLRSVLYSETSHIPESLGLAGAKSLQWGRSQQAWNSSAAPVNVSALCAYEIHVDGWSDDIDSLLPKPKQDAVQPTIRFLFQLAQARIRRIATQQLDSYPVALYPTAGEAEAQFTATSGRRHRHANMEISRVNYMLACVNQRRIPQVTRQLIAELLTGNDVIELWPDMARILKNRTQSLIRTIICNMAAPGTPMEFPKDARSFVCSDIPYETDTHEENLSQRFWHRALSDFTKSKHSWSPAQVESFLQIHAFLKDSIGGLRTDTKLQAQIFLSMLDEMRVELDGMELDFEVWEEIVAQLAFESSFMAYFRDRQAAYIHFCEDQQLVYSYVDIDDLGHSEFACPAIVTEMIRDTVDGDDDEHSIAPVTVAYGYPICSSHGSRAIVVDGNNRVISILFLRFISLHGIPETGNVEPLREYCRDHGLGPVCFVDLCEVIESLRKSHEGILDRLRNWKQLSSFRNICQIPALVTEESSFLTTLKTDQGERYLQPVQQSVFASDDMLVALPSKMQFHGRPKGFRPLPIR